LLLALAEQRLTPEGDDSNGEVNLASPTGSIFKDRYNTVTSQVDEQPVTSHGDEQYWPPLVETPNLTESEADQLYLYLQQMDTTGNELGPVESDMSNMSNIELAGGD
jgi:hypothetical protein